MPQDAGLIEPPQRSQVEQHRSISAAGQAQPDAVRQLTFDFLRRRIGSKVPDGRTSVDWSIGGRRVHTRSTTPWLGRIAQDNLMVSIGSIPRSRFGDRR